MNRQCSVNIQQMTSRMKKEQLHVKLNNKTDHDFRTYTRFLFTPFHCVSSRHTLSLTRLKLTLNEDKCEWAILKDFYLWVKSECGINPPVKTFLSRSLYRKFCMGLNDEILRDRNKYGVKSPGQNKSQKIRIILINGHLKAFHLTQWIVQHTAYLIVCMNHVVSL